MIRQENHQDQLMPVLQKSDLWFQYTPAELLLHRFLYFGGSKISTTGLPLNRLSIRVGGHVVVWTNSGLVYSYPDPRIIA